MRDTFAASIRSCRITPSLMQTRSSEPVRIRGPLRNTPGLGIDNGTPFMLNRMLLCGRGVRAWREAEASVRGRTH